MLYLLFILDQTEIEEIFSHDLIQRHSSVACIKEMPNFNKLESKLKFGIYNYNFFHEASNSNQIKLNSIWTPGKQLDTFQEVVI